MNEYTIFWLTGNSQVVKGENASSAMNNAGIGLGAIRLIDFYAEGDKTEDYVWNKQTKSWDKNVITNQ